MGPADVIRDLTGAPLAAAGFELWDVEVTPDTVRVLVERDGGIDLDAVSEASAVVSELLDAHPELTPDSQYQLEVSSPGVERTLRTPQQYRRYLGAEVAIKTSQAVAGARRLRGTLSAVTDDGVELLVSDPPGSGAVSVPHSSIQRTRTVLVWGPTPAPGRRAPTRTSARTSE